MKDTFILGVDPGFTGAVALYATASKTLSIMDMPTITDPKGRTVIDMKSLFENIKPPADTSIQAFVELVAARPGQGAPATFRFGQGYGALQMALTVHDIPIQYVTPNVWKKHFGLSKDKGVSRGLARQRFPHYADLFERVKDDGRAEATLIALYGAEKLRLN